MAVLMLLVVAIGAGASQAFFNDQESASGNSFTAGTIDIAVDGQNPWARTEPYVIEDLKPCETGYITFEVKNVGTNPAVLWTHTNVTGTDTGLLAYPVVSPVYSSEPEAVVAQANQGFDNNRIDKVINYDLVVGNQPIFVDADGLSVDDIQCAWMPIGTLEAGQSVVVKQSYHLRPSAGNEYQGDKMTFTIDLYAEQRLGPGPSQLSNKLFLDNKTGNPDWYFSVDQTWGIVTWDAARNVTVLAQGLESLRDYSLVEYTETNAVQVIVAGTTDAAGKLGPMTSAPIAAYSGKIWLVPTDNIPGGVLNWADPDLYLFEGNIANIV